jgi:hypothetical protein
MASHFDFVDVVVANRDLVVTSAYAHACRLEPRESAVAWFCDLDDGTPTGDSDPASFVRWVCPALGTGTRATGPTVPLIDVHRAGPQSDLGKILKKFSFLSGRPPAGEVEGKFVYTDPAGILDAELRGRIENWPSALHGDGVVRPAELGSIQRTREGLTVGSGSWWGSTAALDHQIGLALDIAHRLTARR